MRSKLLLLALLCTSVARADGIVIGEQLLGASHDAVVAKVAAARSADPDIFRMVQASAAHLPIGYERTRSRRPEHAGLVYRRIGARGLWAMVDVAALEAVPRGTATSREWDALRTGLLDAIGVQAEPLLQPMFTACFGRDDTPGMWSAAAMGLGRLGDAGLAPLLAHAQVGDVRFEAAVRGLGVSRRPQAMNRLATLLDAVDEAHAALVADAIAEGASSWAWATGRVGTKAEQSVVVTAARASLQRNRARFSAETAARLDSETARVSR